MSEKKLRVLVVGASGTIGKAVVTELSQRHEIVTAGSKSGDVQINIEDVARYRRIPQKCRKMILQTGD
jgi:nucleoside-diphosphate-sugar epimerase